MTSSDNQILNIHKAFMIEYAQATTQLSQFYDTVESFFKRILSETDENEDNLQKNINTIQDVCFFLRTFCSETTLHVQMLKGPHKDDAMLGLIEDQAEVDDMEYKQRENPNEVYPFELYPEIFTYKAVDPSKFMKGLEAEFFVSYIKDNANLLFFIMDASCRSIVFNDPELRYDIIPEKGVVFGLLLDGEIVRAVRENSITKRPTSFKVYLIDFGEILEVTKDFKMYRLPEEIQQVPGQAIFCKLFMNEFEDYDYPKFLEDKLNRKAKIRIMRVYKNMLEVTFVPLIDMSALASRGESPYPSSTHNSSNYESLSDDTTTLKNHVPKTATLVNGVSGLRLKSSNPFIDMKDGVNGFTQKDIDELYEEPLNTESALEAVMGYIPQDEKRICRFYDPKTNACFKGAHCKLEHTTILKDGWTKDRMMSKLKIHSQIAIPKIGKKINVIVTYVVDVDRFYGQILPKNCKSLADSTAEMVVEKMNKPEISARFKKFDRPPDELELVFAKFTDDFWYRAKILQKLSNSEYKVFYVDYGNCYNVNLDQIRCWDDAFDAYPFQALEFRLDNVTKIKNFHKEAIAYFETKVLKNSVVATVTCNFDILRVTLQDAEKFDIGDQLCAAEYAKPKPITQCPNGNFPG